MKELDFSEEACMDRYVTFPYFDDEAENILVDEAAESYDTLLRTLHMYGSICVDLTATAERPQTRRIPAPTRMAA